MWLAAVAFVSLIAMAGNPKEPAPQAAGGDAKGLQKVLAEMDKSAANFHTTQANFLWEQYEKVVDEKDDQKGVIYYRRQGKEIQMMADLSDPPKKVLFAGGKVEVFNPRTKEANQYDVGKHRDTVETFLVLGFGGSGHELEQAFEVKYLGKESIDGVETDKLELAPKAESVRNLYGKIWLWIDPARGVSLQQQFFDLTTGNYRLAKYRDIQINQKVADSVFKLPSDTKYVAPPKN
jgi:outer membrane lipoprotein-sorting protein